MSQYFIEREPKDKRRDDIGRELKGREGCEPWNRKNPSQQEMDEFFGCYE